MSYSRINWENTPSIKTPISAENLRHMEDGIVLALEKLEKKSKIGSVTLLASEWTGQNNLFKQVVTIDGVTENSQVDLTPSPEQLAIFYQKDLSLVTENDGGVITVYAIGQKLEDDYTMQVTITEVTYEQKNL